MNDEPKRIPEVVKLRKPYLTPHVERLGSVRDLTMGGVTSPLPDGGAGSRKAGG